ncbi:ski-like protein isoform X1 [Syngnathus acus]|uniref:ski-like protein isoform X1 n=2 Tax=Syngnathus acus TaxID=161584 RepID=UPI001885E6A9|nr:ski-like protein isoform X1 [Syngnathus acus]XP_037131441.1 ski-like protein isoform X1 [Syngnathus acus]
MKRIGTSRTLHHACVHLSENQHHLIKGEKSQRDQQKELFQKARQEETTTTSERSDMASTQTSLKSSFKGLSTFKGSMKRLYRERLEDAPIKKRVMAEINLKRRGLESFHKAAKVKREQVEEAHHPQLHHRDTDAELYASAKALDLSPGLKHTLAQFTLSSQSSLGGPAAFSARGGLEPSHAGMPPLPSPPVLGGGPLLVPCDSSTELTHSPLEGESISCFVVGGEKRLCLPQVLNSVLRDFSLQQINTVCDELYVYCSRCDAQQLHILKVLGILPFNAPSCGLITLTDAQRLCNALLRPGAALPAELSGQGPLKESEAGFQVEHQCLGKCQGLFLPQFYSQPEAPCVQCVECHLLFSPQKFVMHSHKLPDKRTCHWGFDSAKWPCYLQLARKYQGSPQEAELKRLLDEVKGKFHYQLKRTLDKKAAEDQENQARKSSADLCSSSGKLAEAEPTRKGKMSSTMVYNQLFPDIKEEPGHPTLVHPSYYLYTYDKMVAPNVSLRREAEMSPEILGALLKHHYGRGAPHHDEPPMDLHASPPLAEEAKSQHAAELECQTQAVSMETSSLSGKTSARTRSPPHAPPPLHLASPPPATETADKDAGCAVNMTLGALEDDKDRIVVEIMQMYGRQQEKLNSTLHKQLQLEMELEALRGGEATRLRELSAEQRELRTELEAVHSEQARQLGQARQEQLELETRLEQLRQQACACEPAAQRQQEAHYAAQLSELRQRLERAESDRQELQEELRREREARENLERTIGQLKQQMALSCAAVPAGASPSPPLTPSTGPPNAHSPASSSPSSASSFSEAPK